MQSPGKKMENGSNGGSVHLQQPNLIVLALATGLLCRAVSFVEAAPFQPLTLHSRSGQFIVGGVPMQAKADPASVVLGGVLVPARSYTVSTSSVSFVRLDPALVAMSCEEIKGALLKELGARDQWKAPVTIAIHPVRDDNEPIFITSVHYANGWSYQLGMADQVDRSVFINAIVQVIVTEIANRQAGARQSELPPWLAAGLAEHLQATSLAGLTFELQTGISKKQRNSDPLAKVREFLRSNPPLTIDELDWPPDNAAGGVEEAVYQHCAHLLVHDLLRLKGGRSQLLEMLKDAHNHLNWQTAFFRAFGAQFPRLIDFDKWWMMRVAQFTQGEAFSMLRPEEQWRQVNDALSVRASTRHNTNEVSVNGPLTLQRVITEWPFRDQHALLLQKVQALRALELRMEPQAAQLIEEYRSVLEKYLRARERTKRSSLLKETIKRLDDLDVYRQQIKNPTGTKAASAQSIVVANP